ncbi:MAG TPA: GNAT family N-acetyltransferase [Streptomyces sp.]
MAVAYAGGEAVGFGYGFPCDATYWFGEQLLGRVPEGTRLHTALLQAITPKWSSLLVQPENSQGWNLYQRLGYRYAGPYRNTPTGPEYDLLLLRVEPS